MESLTKQCLLAFVVLLLSCGALGEYCFRNREARGGLGTCTVEIQDVSTKAECCTAGGSGWTEKANGKRCADTCEGLPEDEEEDEAPPPDPPLVVEDITGGYCFRTRVARGSLGACEDLIGEKTRTDCCRYGGDGWTDRSSGKRCTDTCEGVVDTGPRGTCFSNWRTNRRRCFNPVGEMTRLQCCRQDGAGWSILDTGANCEDSCLADPVDGGWSEFSEWGQCSVTCEEGRQTRTRTCTDPPPAHGGADCVGRATEEAICLEGPCPIHGGWGDWGAAGDCQATCQTARVPVYKAQQRPCNNPEPAHGGNFCEGPSSRRIRCRALPYCPIDGAWSDYGDWSDCSQTCDTGVQIRERRCDNPPPNMADRTVPEFRANKKNAETDALVQYMVDGHRGVSGRNVMLRSVVSTAENCGHERVQTQTRDTGETIARVVSSTQKSVQYVQVRNSIHFELAYTGSCGVLTYSWSAWSVWLPCSDGCRKGSVRNRFRKCEGIGRCEGDYMETQSCRNLDPCPDEVDGSGSGSGSGQGIDVICDDEDECLPYQEPEISYSYDNIEDVEVDCNENEYDYSIYSDQPNDCNNNVPGGPGVVEEPEEPENKGSSSIDYSDDDVPIGVPVPDAPDEDSYSLDEDPVPDVQGEDDSYSIEEDPVPDVQGEDDSYSLDEDPVPDVQGEDDSYSLDEDPVPDVQGEDDSYSYEDAVGDVAVAVEVPPEEDFSVSY
ncbi:hypothetical protein BSL78_23469 [Apostichopus japonicus]|uniref:TB domain-containing protein n=1 Tax=Stichopus japonicus TaxID=307972 RepID=A0A2G8JVI1_STIJA|nr:hypothetical protein BSL78_23469 [Apostichopus japonicus]